MIESVNRTEPMIHVFVDAENLLPARLPVVAFPPNLQITLILGPAQHALKAKWEARWKRCEVVLKFVRMHSGGPNALDFLISFHVGEAVAHAQSGTVVYIVSRDKGFDPLVDHLLNRKILAKRVESLDFLPIAISAQRMSTSERVEFATNVLGQYEPGTRSVDRSLRMLQRVFQRCLPQSALEAVLEGLVMSGFARYTDAGSLQFPLTRESKKSS